LSYEGGAEWSREGDSIEFLLKEQVVLIDSIILAGMGYL